MKLHPNELDLTDASESELLAVMIEAQQLGKKHEDAFKDQLRRQNVFHKVYK